jgi:plasmid stabilization system protein ParE
MKEFPVEYLPAAVEDLKEIYDYIALKLHAPKAAENFLDAMDKAAEQIGHLPFSCKVYHPSHPLKYEIRQLIVNNFIAFYEVDIEAERVIIHRVVYGGRNAIGLLFSVLNSFERYKLKGIISALLLLFIVSFSVAAQTNTDTNIPSPQQLKALAETLPPYSAERDCGFEALNVFEKFGGYIVVAQNPIPNGIYSVKKVDVPPDLAVAAGPDWHGFCIWNHVTYLYYVGFGCYEITLIENANITEHRGINMRQNGAHVWNIINGVVIDISWARQIMDTFLETVICDDTY